SSTNRERNRHDAQSRLAHVAQIATVLANRNAGSGGPLLGELDRGADFPDADENLGAQLSRRGVTAAVLLHHPLDHLLQAVLAQAGPALVQMLADLGAVQLVQFAVQVAVDPVQHLGTRSLVGVSAAHRPSSPDTEASEAARASPRSAA